MTHKQREKALRKKLKERRQYVTTLGKILGTTRQSAQNKLKGICKFYPAEIDKLRIAWNLTDAEVVDLFIKQ